ncbi:MAG: hypothetical protein VKO21_04290 [Candidatus Sericytochromatia bacterium]|nr:hypothetical protein [Candidatus Sericytochromatia bacterium]
MAHASVPTTPSLNLGRLALVLFLMLLAFFHRATLEGQVLSPAELLRHEAPYKGIVPEGHPNALRSDDVFLATPTFLTHVPGTLRGDIPFTDPAKLGGDLGGMGWVSLGQVLYPPAWVYGILPPTLAPLAFAIVRLLAGGLGMALLIRQLGLPGWTAWFGAVAFTFTGSSVVWLSSPIPSVTICLPWAWLGMEWLLAGNRRRGLPTLILACGIQFLAGYLPQSLLFGLAVASWGGVRLVQSQRRWADAGLLLTGGLGGLGLGVLGWLPSLLALSGSDVANRTVAGDAFNPLHLVTWLVPNFFGNPVFSPWMTGGNYCELIAYAGFLPAALAVTSVTGFLRQTASPANEREILFPALVVLVLAAGCLYGWPGFAHLSMLPGLSAIPPGRWTGIIAAILPVLAAHGAARWERMPLKVAREGLVLASLGALGIAVAYLTFWPTLVDHRMTSYVLDCLAVPVVNVLLVAVIAWKACRHGLGRSLQRALMALVFVDLLAVGSGFNPTVPAAGFYPWTPGLRAAANASTDGRVLPLEGLLPGDLPGLYGLRSLTGYDLRGDRTWRKALASAGDGSQDPLASITGNAFLLATTGPGRTRPNELWLNVRPEHPWLDLWSVRCFLLPPASRLRGTDAADLIHDGSDMQVIRNPGARPMAWWTPDLGPLEDKDAPVRALPPVGDATVSLAAPAKALRVLDWEVPDEGWIVVAERAALGWTPSGTMLAWQEAAGGVLALKVAKGRGTARLDFAPAPVVAAFWTSLAMLISMSILLAVSRRT